MMFFSKQTHTCLPKKKGVPSGAWLTPAWVYSLLLPAWGVCLSELTPAWVCSLSLPAGGVCFLRVNPCVCLLTWGFCVRSELLRGAFVCSMERVDMR